MSKCFSLDCTSIYQPRIKTAARAAWILVYFGRKMHQMMLFTAFLQSPLCVFASVPRCCHMKAQVSCHTPAALCSWQGKAFRLLLHTCQCWLLFHSILVYHGFFQIPGGPDNEYCVKLSFAVLTDDKAASAKNGRTQENSPERAGKGCVFSASSDDTCWQVLALSFQKLDC